MSQSQTSASQSTPVSAPATENVPVSLPPLRHMSKSPPTPLSTDRRSGSLLGVHSILNPQAELVEQERNRRRSASRQMETPSPIDTHPSQSLPSISRPMSVDSTQGDAQARLFQPPERPARHLMSPRSPTVHRNHSISLLARPTGTIDAHASPFLSTPTTGGGRVIGPDPTSQPSLPTPPGGGRGGFYPPMPSSAPTPPPGMSRMGFPQSGSASPNPNFSPYSQPASAASSQYDGPTPYPPPSNNAPMHDHRELAMAMEQHHQHQQDHNRMSMGPSGQSAIQIMTIKSQQGHHVRIPVEVQAASKVADEKRKRNAGASARFRARRKEKEREASQSISRLETQLREALEDSEYYRGERDYFKSIVFQQPGAERHYARPPSPRLRRLSVAPSNAASSTTGGGSVGSPYSAYDDEGDDRNVRRRTSNYHPAPGQAPTSLNGSQPPASYPPPAFASINAPPPPHSRPSSFDARDERSLPQMPPQQHQRPALHDPFAPADPGRYESRSWQPHP
ncbi:hypothetical protein DM02DRAFT_311834 [Periconia macrospinosa]|uniref:BZIP domain-containing protein n=1 Tax=Periconia macrospinosa TaxID=97972 RepID=A0A2V1D1I6_9PLEO|nr:hypothetical protein DM02DRAFT_311834 [Periconia macrospinosa]